jgi:hypothetical protein
LTRGAVLLFYRSGDAHAVTAIGVADSQLRSSDPTEIRRFVSLRTVYPDAEIRGMCAEPGGSGVLAILFRHDRSLSVPWSLHELQEAEVLRGAPQSIQKVTNKEALTWLARQLDAPL